MLIKPIVSIFLLILASNVFANVNFKHHSIAANFTITHPLKHARFSGDEEQLLVIGVTKSGQRTFAVYQPENLPGQPFNFHLLVQKTIPERFISIDILASDNRDSLLFLDSQGVTRYNFESGNFERLITADTIYLQENAQYLADREFTVDANNDGLQDIVLADFKATHYYLQQPSGEFIPMTLPIYAKSEMNRDSIEYKPQTIYYADISLDGRQDIVLMKDAGLIYFEQTQQGLFNTIGSHLELPIDVKALEWWEQKEANGEQLDQANLAYRSMNQIKDINNDNLPDLLIRFSQSSGVLDRKNNYEVYLGKSSPGGLKYEPKPSSVLAVSGTTVGIKTIDLNGDQLEDVMLNSLDIGVSQIIGALLSGSIDQDVKIFKMDENGHYQEEPEVEREVDLTFSLSSGKSGQPVVKLADFNGDGLQDLLFSDGEKTLRVYIGETKERMFNSRSKKHKVAVPKDGAYVTTRDVNHDGKDDVLIRYGRQDDEALANQIVIMFAE
ncbi:FG-GAP repeat domain-containing protein [Aliikangiella sp. IMCC44653]